MGTFWFSAYTLKNSVSFKVFLVAILSTYMIGCERQMRLSSAQLAEFENASPSVPTVDVDIERLLRAKMDAEPYRVVSGDVLELTMPVILQVLVTELPDIQDKFAPYLCRVSDNGTITLPMIGEIQVVGKTLPEIESAIIDAYYPTYTITRPSVIARVAEYKTYKASITGAVQKPGFYELHSDQMSLVALLMQAGGIIDEGAARIRITNAKLTKAGREKHEDYVPYRHAIEYAARSNETQRVRPASYYLDSSELDGVDAQMTFQPVSPSSTIGRLTIRHGQTILFNEQIDAANQTQMSSVLDKLAGMEPHIAAIEMGRVWLGLCELAELFNPSYSMRNTNEAIRTASFGIDKKISLSDSRQTTMSNNNLGKLSAGIEVIESTQNNEKAVSVEPGKSNSAETIVLPVKGLNIPFSDVPLKAGDVVEVEPYEAPLFTVVGLVNKPGNFPYPPTAQYNLMQAIAFAGGLDRVAKPRYATVYRLKEDGSIVRAPFRIIGKKNDPQIAESLSIPIKTGDIVIVEDTPRTRTNEFLRRVFNFNFGAYFPVTEFLR